MADKSQVHTIQASDGTTLIEIAAAPNSDEADLLCGFLESEGIPARIEHAEDRRTQAYSKRQSSCYGQHEARGFANDP